MYIWLTVYMYSTYFTMFQSIGIIEHTMLYVNTYMEVLEVRMYIYESTMYVPC